jgi:hypothetical protein
MEKALKKEGIRRLTQTTHDQITKNQPGKGSSFPRHIVPEVWIVDFAGDDQAGRFCSG